MTNKESKLSWVRLREVLNYDPQTGIFTRLWISPFANRKYYIGMIAGRVTNMGYRSLRIDGLAFSEHRLAWFYMTKCWPADQIDHIDGERSNNRWSNLREASCQQNLRNSKTRKGHKSLKGVKKARNQWEARIWLDGKMLYLGLYKTPEEANAAYIEAATKLFGEFARQS